MFAETEQKEAEYVKHNGIISQMTVEEKCYLMSGKLAFFRACSVSSKTISTFGMISPWILSAIDSQLYHLNSLASTLRHR